jgi:plastocyanin
MKYKILFSFAILLFSVSISAHELEDVAVVHMSPDGYEPSEIFISVGERVYFENVGESSHWPASDSHPSLTGYSGTTVHEHCGEERNSNSFDACRGIDPSESYIFVFEKAGVHEYHDHLSPHLSGVVRVSEIETAESEMVEDMSRWQKILSWIRSRLSGEEVMETELLSGSAPDSFNDSLFEKYTAIVVESDAREAILTLKEDSLADESIMSLCHDVLHEIGHSAFEKYGSFQAAVEYQQDFCNSGYIHGVFESHFEFTENPEEGLQEQCQVYREGKRDFDLWQCYHGIGHGFMYLTGGDLEESIEMCSNSIVGDDSRNCHNGAYMEVFNSEILTEEYRFVSEEDPFETCRAAISSKADCYNYVPVYLVNELGLSYEESLSECSRSEQGFERICIFGVASEAYKRNQSEEESLFKLCDSLDSFSDRVICIKGLASMSMFQAGSQGAGYKFCENASIKQRLICDGYVDSKSDIFELK